MILFTRLYGAIVVGALVFMSKINYSEMNLILTLLLSIFLFIFFYTWVHSGDLSNIGTSELYYKCINDIGITKK